MNSGASRRFADMPTVAAVAFPDGRTGLFGVRDTSSVRTALVAFALAKMSLRPEPVPVLATPPEPETEPDEPAAPTVDDVVGSIRVTDLRDLEEDAADDLVASHLGPIPPAISAALPADEALARLDDHEIALVVTGGHEVTGVVTRNALVTVVHGDQPEEPEEPGEQEEPGDQSEPNASIDDGSSSRGA